MVLINKLRRKRKILCHVETGNRQLFYTDGINPCGCGSNLFRYEYDGENVYGVCNSCDTDIYALKEEYKQEYLERGIWK